MRVAHLLRKYDPSEWGGTETAVKRLLDGLSAQGVASVVFCPHAATAYDRDPFQEAGHTVKRFHAFMPVCRISPEDRKRLISVGGNLMSFDLIWKLFREPGISLIHTHALNRLGGIGLRVARRRRVPLVVTVHGGVLDLPAAVHENLLAPLRGGVEWGKLFGLFLRSRRVLDEADAIITCNRKEAALFSEKYPAKPIVAQPHGVPASLYRQDHRAAARQSFPQMEGKTVLLSVGRIEPVKNQAWLVQQLPAVLANHPNTLLVLVGACLDEAYGKSLKKEVRKLGLDQHVLLTGGLPPADPLLIGLFQSATALVLPSIAETFGLVIIEAWAAGTAVICSRTTGASGLITHREDGWLFDLDNASSFHEAVKEMFVAPAAAKRVGETGQRRAAAEFDTTVLAGRIKDLYGRLIEEKSG